MATTEIQLEENLGADHPKLQAFQKAVAAALRKRLQEADEVRAHHMFSRIFNCFFVKIVFMISITVTIGILKSILILK